jgi:diketogulonate reductase-like aldo/keto reductase
MQDKIPAIERDGGAMPVLGLGTWQNDGVIGRRAVREAVDLGYRHIDTAQMYENEEEVGQAVKESGVHRNGLFITTKLAPGHLRPANVLSACDRSLKRLVTDYVDLLLIHWPDESVPLAETLAAMEELRKQGKVRHIGVSNFTVDLLKRVRAVTDVPIFCNQVEYHPYLDQSAVLSFCRDQGIAVVAYCPLAQGKVIDDRRLAEIGSHYDKTAAQVALRWLIGQEGVAAIPKATSKAHLEENLDVLDFSLTDAEAAMIAGFEKGERLIDPSWAPDWD